jgi:hypothetical protein
MRCSVSAFVAAHSRPGAVGHLDSRRDTSLRGTDILPERADPALRASCPPVNPRDARVVGQLGGGPQRTISDESGL